MARIIKVFLTLSAIIALIVTFVLQGKENDRIKGTNTIRLHTQISVRHIIPDGINENDPNVDVTFYRKDGNGNWEQLNLTKTVDGKTLPDFRVLSVDRLFNCDSYGWKTSFKNVKATHTEMEFTPYRKGEYKYVISYDGTEIGSGEYDIINQTLWYYIKELVTGFIMTPIYILIIAPIKWIGNNAFWKGLGNKLFGGGLLSFVLIIGFIFVYFIVLFKLRRTISGECEYNEPSKEEFDNTWPVLTTLRLSIYLGMFFTILRMHSVNYLEHILDFSNSDVTYALLSYGALAFIAFIKSIVAIIRKQISALRLLLVLIDSALLVMCLHLGGLAVFFFIIAGFFHGAEEVGKDCVDTYAISYKLAQLTRTYDPDDNEDEDTAEVATRPKYMLPAMYINHKIKKAERQDEDDE